MNCSDPRVLQRLLDGDLGETEAELVTHHLESCSQCREAARDLAALSSFVQHHLGAEDEGEEEAAAATLARISRQFPVTGRWRHSWVLRVAAACLIATLPLVFVSTVRAWPNKILEEAAERERMWMYQPGKILQWEVQTVSRGVKGIADGQWRTLFWQKNGDTSFTQISRQFDPFGRTNHAYWLRPDGSSIRYQPKVGEVIEIWPSVAEAQAALPSLAPELRASLESHLSRAETSRSLEFNRRRNAEWLHQPSSSGNVTFRRSLLDQWGEVFHIRVVTEPSTNPRIVRAVHDYDIERSSLRLVRLRSTITYTDGTVGVHDARWANFRDTSAAEYHAQTPQDLLASGLPVVRLTPLEVAQRRLREMNHTATR